MLRKTRKLRHLTLALELGNQQALCLPGWLFIAAEGGGAGIVHYLTPLLPASGPKDLATSPFETAMYLIYLSKLVHPVLAVVMGMKLKQSRFAPHAKPQ